MTPAPAARKTSETRSSCEIHVLVDGNETRPRNPRNTPITGFAHIGQPPRLTLKLLAFCFAIAQISIHAWRRNRSHDRPRPVQIHVDHRIIIVLAVPTLAPCQSIRGAPNAVRRSIQQRSVAAIKAHPRARVSSQPGLMISGCPIAVRGSQTASDIRGEGRWAD